MELNMKNLLIQKQQLTFLRSSIAARVVFTSAMLIAIGSWASSTAYAIQPLTPVCSTYDIVTVKGTAGNDLFGTELLGLIGYQMAPGGSVEFEYSYELRPQISGLYYSPGTFRLKSLDASGDLVGHYVYSEEPVGVAVRDDVQVETSDGPGILDHYSAGIEPVANGFRYLLVLHLADSVDHNVLPGSPLVYLNDLSRWPYASFGIGVDVDATGKYIFAGGGSVTSLSATITPGCTSTQSLTDLVNGLPDSAFRSDGNRNALLTRVQAISALISAGNYADAITALKDLKRKFDGCGTSADTNDWILGCPEQVQFRNSVDQLIVALGGTP